MKARGIANVVVVFWNNRVLKPIGMKKGNVFDITSIQKF